MWRMVVEIQFEQQPQEDEGRALGRAHKALQQLTRLLTIEPEGSIAHYHVLDGPVVRNPRLTKNAQRRQ